MERARRSVWCLSTYSLTSYLLTYLRPASRGQRGLPHLLQRGRTAGHLAPHALARPSTPSMVRLPSWWRHGALPWPPGAAPPGSWLRHALETHSGRTRDEPPSRAAPKPRPKVADYGRRSPILWHPTHRCRTCRCAPWASRTSAPRSGGTSDGAAAGCATAAGRTRRAPTRSVACAMRVHGLVPSP